MTTPFTIATNLSTRSATKLGENILWDFDPATSTIESDHDRHEIRIFERLVIGRDAIGITPDGERLNFGELCSFAVNEPGIAVPHSLARQRRGSP